MHELGITRQIVDIACRRAGGDRVTRVVVELGHLLALAPDSVRFCFELCANGTAAQGAQLVIHEIPARARCAECGAELLLEQPFGRCACGSSNLTWLSGEELKISEIEVLSCAQLADATPPLTPL